MIQNVKISEVKANPNNPRLIKDDKFKKLVKSIQEFPEMLQLRPIVVNDDMIVLGGNMRLKACKEAGLKEVPIIKASDLTDEQQREFIIKDNVGFGEWDWSDLANNWDTEKLEEWGLDLPVDLSVQELEAEEDDFEIPEEIKTDIVLGDLFEIGEHRLLCGDSTDSDQVAKLMNGEKADMVFTSPPYNGNTTMYDYVIVDGKKKRKDKPLYENNETDNKTSQEYIDFLHSVMNICFINTYGYIFWNINYNAKSRFEYIECVYPYRDKLQETIVWKKNAIPTANGLTRNFEFIFMFKTNEEIRHLNKEYDVTHNVWEVNNSGSQTDTHKACFPIGLPSKAIALNESTKLIFEPFTGSGTTMVASHQLKRKCYGMELDPKYCQVIIDRMRKLDSSLVIKKNGVEII
jgi:DNA modification methylase